MCDCRLPSQPKAKKPDALNVRRWSNIAAQLSMADHHAKPIHETAAGKR
jgi:hypothetical protein